MAYLDLYSEELTRKLKKIKNKNIKLYDIIDKKIAEIILYPERYKELRYDMKEFRRVHIQKSFVLTFKIDIAKEIVKFEDFDHHDKIYKRRY
jgi:YafQ family addiction module toxin component